MSKSEGKDNYKNINGDFKTYSFVLANVPETQYDIIISCRIYIKYTYQGKEKIMYSNILSSSYNECVNNGKIAE